MKFQLCNLMEKRFFSHDGSIIPPASEDSASLNTRLGGTQAGEPLLASQTHLAGQDRKHLHIDL